MKERILVVDDEESIRFTFDNFLTDEGYEVICAPDLDDAEQYLTHDDPDLVFVDIFLENDSGIDLLKSVQERNPHTPVIMITGAPSIETATECLRHGAFDYIVKPVRQDAIVRSANAAIRHKTIIQEKEKCRLNFEAIFASVRDGIILVDETLSVAEINTAACRLCTVQRSEILGKNITMLGGRCQGRCLSVLQHLLTGCEPVVSKFVECQAAHDASQVVSLTASPLLTKGEGFTGAVLVMRDETPVLKLQQRLDEYLRPGNIVGQSACMQEMHTQIQELSRVQSTVLITGESGTGKELVVDALHFHGNRRKKPLIKVNCAALPQDLLESELFGHVAGAFTGAIKNTIGRFKRADGGTLFLDEIGDISPRMQLRLLRVLETMEFERVGDSNPIKVDVRIIAATNQNLKKKIACNEFRSDLYYRLNVVEINLPPLRKRIEDMPLLLDHFIAKFNREFNKRITGVTTSCINLLTSYPWPDNIRELENTLEHCFIRCAERVITASHLPAELLQQCEEGHLSGASSEEQEMRLIQQALHDNYWNKSKAAASLGISRRTIYRKMEKFGFFQGES
jgi:two-component system response regulator HydG